MRHNFWIEGCYTTVAYHAHDGPMVHDQCWDTIEEVDLSELNYDERENVMIVQITKLLIDYTLVDGKATRQ